MSTEHSDRRPSSPPTPGSGAPALRASDADRERTVEVLRRAGGDGRLDLDELDERVTAAYAARTHRDLQSLTGDLLPASAPDVAAAPAPGDGVTVSPGRGGSRLIVSVMGRVHRRGRWRVAARCLVAGVMGGADLDLCDAELSDPTTTIRVLTIMGGACLRFPSGVDVRVGKLAIMGGHDVRLDAAPPPAGAPVIRLQMLAIMGGTEIRQGRREKRTERSRLNAQGRSR